MAVPNRDEPPGLKSTRIGTPPRYWHTALYPCTISGTVVGGYADGAAPKVPGLPAGLRVLASASSGPPPSGPCCPRGSAPQMNRVRRRRPDDLTEGLTSVALSDGQHEHGSVVTGV